MHWTVSRAYHPVLNHPIKQMHRHTRASLAESSQASHAGPLALTEEAEESELVQPGETSNSFFPVSARKLSRRWSCVFTMVCGGKMRGNGLKQQQKVSDRVQERLFVYKDGETVELVVQRGSAVSVAGGFQDEVG